MFSSTQLSVESPAYSPVSDDPLTTIAATSNASNHSNQISKQNYNSSLSSSNDSAITSISNINESEFHSVSLDHNNNQLNDKNSNNDSNTIDNSDQRLSVSIAEFQSHRGILRSLQIFCCIVSFSSLADVLGFDRYYEFEAVVLIGCIGLIYSFSLTLTYFFIDSIVPQRLQQRRLQSIQIKSDLTLAALAGVSAFAASLRCTQVCSIQRSYGIQSSCAFAFATSTLFLLTARQTKRQMQQNG
jgi:hypothetical protein